MKTEYIAIIIMLIVAAILLYYGFITLIKNKHLKNDTESTIDIKAFLQALGGSQNILDVTSSPSKVTVQLKNQSLVDMKTIQSLGASGIVEGKDTLSMIFGKQSISIANDLKKMR